VDSADVDSFQADTSESEAVVQDDAKPSSGDQEEEAASEVEEAPIVWEDAPPEAIEAKAMGNAHFKNKEYDEAITCYDEALGATPDGHPDTAVFYANRAACLLAQGDHEGVVSDCTSSLEVRPGYVKALLRRGRAYDALGKAREALKDLKEGEAAEAGSVARADILRLEKTVREIEEKEKEEMFGKLKDLGNSFLGRFGMSTDNFKFDQNPDGNYNIQFVQNP